MDSLGDSEFSRSSAAFIVTAATRPVNRGDCAAPTSISVKPPFPSPSHETTSAPTKHRLESTLRYKRPPPVLLFTSFVGSVPVV